MQRYKTVESYLLAHPEWQPILELLRETILSTELQETVKWGAPVYTIDNKNVVGIGAFKSYAGLWFFNGVLLKDQAKLLINAQPKKTQAMRQWRFQQLEDIDPRLIKLYLQEAIQNQKDGKQVQKAKPKPLIIPSELNEALQADAYLKKSYQSLSLGKQRDYAEYIAQAKRETTKISRLEKIIPMILKKKGLNDKYH